MANIASGYINITFSDKDSIEELLSAIKESSLFDYGGDIDADIGDNCLNIEFSCAWKGEGCWDWIESQLAEGSTLSKGCQADLLNSEISGYTYEYGCQHRDRVSKSPGEERLKRQQANIPNDIFTALNLSKSFDLSPGDRRVVSGGTITLVSKKISADDKESVVYVFYIACGYSLEVTLCVTKSSLDTDEPDYSVLEVKLEDWDPDEDEEDYDETSMFKEILDDIVADIDEIYSSHCVTLESGTVEPEKPEKEADSAFGDKRNDIIGFFSFLSASPDMKNRALQVAGDLDLLVKLAEGNGYSMTKGEFLMLQALRTGLRSSDDRIKNWEKLLRPLSANEATYLDRYQ